MTSGVVTQDWQQILARRSFLEGDALDRAAALLDPDGVRVLCGPFDRLESPWLEPQGIVPQADDADSVGSELAELGTDLPRVN